MNGIGFQEPFFLWALLFLLVVLLIHLLKRPRTVKLTFSTLRFFDESSVKANRSRRLRRFLLLVARFSLVVLLVLLFARPFNRDDPMRVVSDPQHDLYVWIDPTPSMSYREKERSIGDRAYRMLDSLAELRHSKTGIYLYDHEKNDFVTYDGQGDIGFKICYRLGIEELQRAYSRAVERAKRPVFLFVSDFQRTTTRQLVKLQVSDRDVPVPLIAVSLTPRNARNCRVGEVRATFHRETVIRSRIVNQGNKSEAGTFFAIIDNIRTPPVHTHLSAGGDTSVSLVVPRRPEERWGSVIFNSNDPLTFDDTGYFTTGRPGSCSVLLIGDAEANYPVAAALKASHGEMWQPVIIETPESVTMEECTAADVIIINGCRKTAAPLQLLMSTHSTGKQAFLFAPGNSDTTVGIEEQLLDFLAEEDRSVHKMAAPLAVQLTDTLSDLWRGFPSLLSEEVHIYRYRRGLNGDVILRLSNGEPFSVVKRDRFGRVWIVCAGPIGITEENNFCETAFFVPFVDRCARHLFDELRQHAVPWFAGKTMKNPWYGDRNGAQIIAGTGKPVMRLRQQLTFFIDVPGIYTVIPPDGPSFIKPVIPDTLESILDYSVPGEKKGAWVHVTSRELLAYLNRNARSSVWFLPWLLLSLLLLAEVLLGDYRRR